MKTLLIHLFLLCSLSSVFSIETYTTGDNLYIWAISGLNMRANPDAKAAKVLNIPYGEKVKIIDTDLRVHPFSYTMISQKSQDGARGWVLDGHWVKVEYYGKQGYVFDGYLGRFPAITNTPEEIPYFALEPIKNYGDLHWGGLKEEKKVSMLNFDDNKIDPDKGHSEEYHLTFKNGCYYKSFEESFSGYTNIFIKDLSMEEAYLFFNSMTGYEHREKMNREQGMGNTGTFLSSVKKNELYFTGQGMSTTITKVEGGVLIQSGGGC